MKRLLKINLSIMLLFLGIEGLAFALRVMNQPVDFAAALAGIVAVSSVTLTSFALLRLWKVEIDSLHSKKENHEED